MNQRSQLGLSGTADSRGLISIIMWESNEQCETLNARSLTFLIIRFCSRLFITMPELDYDKFLPTDANVWEKMRTFFMGIDLQSSR